MEALSQLSITHVMEAQGASLGREQGREGSGRGWRRELRGKGRRESARNHGMMSEFSIDLRYEGSERQHREGTLKAG